MKIATLAAKAFVYWLERFNHNGSCDELGEALISWCISDGGAEKLGFNYELFLQMTIVLLTTVEVPLKVGIDVSNGKYSFLEIPKKSSSWIPSKEDFDAAVVQVKIRLSKQDS